MKGNPPWGQNLRQLAWLREKHLGGEIDTPNDQGLEKVMIGKLVTRKIGEEVCGQTSLNS